MIKQHCGTDHKGALVLDIVSLELVFYLAHNSEYALDVVFHNVTANEVFSERFEPKRSRICTLRDKESDSRFLREW